jgi:hypothetical protein
MSKDNFAASKIVAAQHCPSFVNHKINEQQQSRVTNMIAATIETIKLQAAAVAATPRLTCHHSRIVAILQTERN